MRNPGDQACCIARVFVLVPSATCCQPPSEPLTSLARRFELGPRLPPTLLLHVCGPAYLQMFPRLPLLPHFPPLFDLAFPLLPLPQLSASQPACMHAFEEQVIVRENAPTWHQPTKASVTLLEGDREEFRRSHQNISALLDTASPRRALALILASNHATGFLAFFFQDS